ncbi:MULTISPECIES: hypothetical protein [unclassified Leifsonia]|uniref:hypothetical protein n=1 Tax=unclassified Leifsonia TaxID=2663824 RepID=UPI0012FCD8A5|nr:MULTISPECIES: hypothetical protein [unclassified Leifsonia]
MTDAQMNDPDQAAVGTPADDFIASQEAPSGDELNTPDLDDVDYDDDETRVDAVE